MELVSALQDTEVRIVARYALRTLTARTVHKSVSARTELPARPRMDGATVQQVRNYIPVLQGR